MKKILSIILMAIMLISMCITAEADEIDITKLSIDEIDELISRLEERRDDLVAEGLDLFEDEDDEAEETDEEEPDPVNTPAPTPIPMPTTVPTKVPTKAPTKVPTKAPTKAPATLKKGSKGSAVTKLQKRLIALKWLSGKATGTYDDKTVAAVKAFQKAGKLKQNGVADAKTQELLYSSKAPKKKVWGTLNYTAVMRQPNKYKGKDYKITGYVLQVMEDYTYQDSLGVYTVLRVATKGKYDNVVYVTWWRSKNSSRVLEDDKVSVYGTCEGLYTYESVRGDSITIPYIDAQTVKR